MRFRCSTDDKPGADVPAPHRQGRTGGDPLPCVEAGTDDAPPPEFSRNAGPPLRGPARSDLRFVAAWGRWMQYTGQHWQFDDTLHAFDLARRICRQAAADCNDTPRVAAAVASAKTVAAVERLAKADRRSLPRSAGIPMRGRLTCRGHCDCARQAAPQHPATTSPRSSPWGRAPPIARDGNRTSTATRRRRRTGEYPATRARLCVTGATREHALFFLLWHWSKWKKRHDQYSGHLKGLRADCRRRNLHGEPHRPPYNRTCCIARCPACDRRRDRGRPALG